MKSKYIITLLVVLHIGLSSCKPQKDSETVKEEQEIVQEEELQQKIRSENFGDSIEKNRCEQLFENKYDTFESKQRKKYF